MDASSWKKGGFSIAMFDDKRENVDCYTDGYSNYSSLVVTTTMIIPMNVVNGKPNSAPLDNTFIARFLFRSSVEVDHFFFSLP